MRKREERKKREREKSEGTERERERERETLLLWAHLDRGFVHFWRSLFDAVDNNELFTVTFDWSSFVKQKSDSQWNEEERIADDQKSIDFLKDG